jgi:hypothetical protein
MYVCVYVFVYVCMYFICVQLGGVDALAYFIILVTHSYTHTQTHYYVTHPVVP